MWSAEFNTPELAGLPDRYRAALLNGTSGLRTAFLGISGHDGQWNAGVFSNVTHVGANPPQMSVLFRPDNGRRHTLEAYKEQGKLTLCALPSEETERLHYCAADFPSGTFEWEALGGSTVHLKGWAHPVPTSALYAVELDWVEAFELNNRCLYTVGAITRVGLSDAVRMNDQGHLIYEKSPAVASGLNTYFSVEQSQFFPFPSLDTLPKK